MAEYQLTNSDVVVRTADGLNIPNDPANADRMRYNSWLAAGNVPDPAPPAPPPPDATDQLNIVIFKMLFNHENRIRTQEARPTITAQQFRTFINSQ